MSREKKPEIRSQKILFQSQDLTNLFNECQSPVFVCFFPFQGLEISLSVSDFKQGLWHVGKSQISSFTRRSNLHMTGG